MKATFPARPRMPGGSGVLGARLVVYTCRLRRHHRPAAETAATDTAAAAVGSAIAQAARRRATTRLAVALAVNVLVCI